MAADSDRNTTFEPRLNPILQQTELPPDYIELEKRVDALKQVHQKLLQVT